MSCDPFRERLALALYDELPPDERAELDAHLQDCAPCRTLQAELEQSLGPLLQAGSETDALPHDWHATLERDLSLERRPAPRPNPWWTAAAGFAAGVLLMFGWSARSPSRVEESALERGPVTTARGAPGTPATRSASDSFRPSAEPPPRTSTRGGLASPGLWLRR